MIRKENLGTEAKLRTLEDMGLVVRIVGGKSRKKTYSIYALITKYEDGNLYILTNIYNPSSLLKKQEVKKEAFEEDPKGAIELRAVKQTGVVLEEYHLIGEKKVANNDSEIEGDEHPKYVYLTTDFDESNIRTTPSDDKRSDIPQYVEIELLKKHLLPAHLWILDVLEKKIEPQYYEKV